MKKSLKAVAIAAAAMIALAGCGGGPADDQSSSAPPDAPTSEAPAAPVYDLTLLPKNLGNPYFDTSNAGAVAAAAEFSANLTYTGPSEGTADSQVSYVQTAVQQGQTGIIFSANDRTAVCDALNAAMAAGVKVVTFDSDTDCRDLFINQATTQGIANTLAKMMVDQAGGKGQVAILSATANATNQNAWIDAVKEILAADHPDIELVDVVYGDDEDQKSFDQTAALVAKYPDLKVICAPTTVGIAAGARYLQDSEYKGKVLMTGLGTPNDMREYVLNGTVTAFALWNPSDLGYLAVYAAKALIDGDITGAEGDQFSAGKLGNYTVGADKTVVLGDAYIFDAGNIADFDF